MKTLAQLYQELGLTPQTKTASKKPEDAIVEFLSKIAGEETSDPVGQPPLPTDLSEAAKNRPDGTTDPSQVLQYMVNRENKPVAVDPSTRNASSEPSMSEGSTSHVLNEVLRQSPAQANTVPSEQLEVVARKIAQSLRQQQSSLQPQVDLDQVFKVAYINDFLARQAAMTSYPYLKTAQEGLMPPNQDVGAAMAAQADPTEEILALLGQASADQLVAKKNELLAAIADILDAVEDGEAEEPAAEKEAKVAAQQLLGLIRSNPALKTKVAQMLTGR